MRFLLPLLAVAVVQAATLHVPAQFTTIPAAFAASAAGDLILVAPGLYTGNLVFPAHAVSLRSEAGPQATVLTAAGGSVVTFQSGQTSATLLEGFTITGGTGTPVTLNGVWRGGVGGGVFCRDGSSPTLRGNWIHDNQGTQPRGVGGGVFAWNSHPLIEQNWIRDNVAHFGGGIFLQSSHSVVRGNVIEGNDTLPDDEGGKGGGVRVLWGTPTIEVNTFVGNHAHWRGSALVFSEPGTVVAVTGNLLAGNSGVYPVDIAYAAHGDLACNLQWGNTPSNSWPVSGYWSDLGGNGAADPLFCDGGGWPWSVAAASPCRPGQNPYGGSCGWIGAARGDCGGVVAADEELPAAWSLGEPWPNPFNPVARVAVAVPELGPARLELFNLGGARVAVLHDGLLEAGTHELQLAGGTLPSGLYLLRLAGDQGTQVRKVSLIR